MKKKKEDTKYRYDVYLEEAKRENQARDRELVRTGQRTKESMFFISREIVALCTVKHRTKEF